MGAGKLEGRRIVLTGVSRGVGFETAQRFLKEGADLIGIGKDPTRLARAAATLETLGRFAPLVADVAAQGAPEAIARAAATRWGAADILFNNAAVMVRGGDSFADEPATGLDESLEVNVLAPLRLSLAMLPLLRKGREPRIVHVSSGAGNFESMRQKGIASYRLSKWSLNGLTMLMSTHLAGEVAVNAFDPGWVKTDLGGPNAPGLPIESAEGALAIVTMPFSVTGKFWKDGHEIPF